jgi:hypothetical protein
LQDPPGANLNTGLWQGFRLIHGQGLTFAAGSVPWERMPGYGLFCGLAGALGALFGGRTLLDLAVATVLLQILFFVTTLAFFVWAAGLLFSPPAVWTLGLLIALVPKELGQTQVDAVIAPVMLLLLASLCLRLKAIRDGRPVTLALDVFTHLTFALWFLMRPDVLPGWLIVSLVLHWRRWRHLLIPVALFLAIGFSWGAYKARYTHEFTLTTTSAGASLFCGLWEVPSRFELTCSDQSYFDWIRARTSFDPRTTAANTFALREVVRFWLTFPGHLAIMLYHKMIRFVDGDLWPGFPTDLQVAFFQVVPRPPVVMFLLTVMALCLVGDYQRYRTLLLAWPLFLDAPVFWLTFASEGRFYSAAGIAVLVAGVPPIFERQFYTSLAGRPWRVLLVLACAGLFAFTRWPLHDWLLRADAFHYWTPLLDPAKSTLSALK